MYETDSEPLYQEEETKTEEGRNWLSVARRSFEASTTYLDANWRKRWEDNLALFQSRHPTDSKYNSDAYKHRSRLFRPKTRASVRKNEAAAAAAFFSNVDVVSVEPENQSDPAQVIGAELQGQLLNYRLQKTIPWFKLVLGAYQETQVYGICVSYQYWKYKEEEREEPAQLTDDMGQPILAEDGSPIQILRKVPAVVEDKPCIELLPVENVRFDTGADWLDVVNTSPYILRCVPMYVQDVKAKMQSGDWSSLDDSKIRQAMVEYDTLRQQRNQQKEDPLSENKAPLTEFEIVWCHENFVRIDGQDWHYWTLGCHHMLTEPKPLKDVYLIGERPFVVGTCVIEAHKPVPDAPVHLGAELQREANDLVNSRIDNVKLVLNKRWIAKRGAQVDVQSMIRNVAGSVTFTDDPEKDIRELNWPDVTASAYQEQDRINVDYDELMGNFSVGSVQTNRQLNETVGGMQMLGGAASQMTEYQLRTFVETWVEPVLRQLVKLEAKYETDLTLISLMGERAKLFQKYGVSEVSDAMLDQELTVRVNVGMGATDPNTKLQKFALAANTYANVTQLLPDADKEAVRKEIFGLAGYRDGARFFADPNDPNAINKGVVPVTMVNQMQQEMGAQMQELAKKAEDAEFRARKLELTAAEKDLQAQQANVEARVVKTVATAQQQMAKPQEQAAQAQQQQAQAQSPIQVYGTDPQLMQMIAAIGQLIQQTAQQQAEALGQIGQAIGQQGEVLQQVLAATMAEKAITVQRGPDGRIAGASARPMMQ